jgi:hypothetical protein
MQLTSISSHLRDYFFSFLIHVARYGTLFFHFLAQYWGRAAKGRFKIDLLPKYEQLLETKLFFYSR